ncbi:NAPDH-dependent diflavin reductase [Coniosporium apollinis]|uniref:NAPDH-dependent diflavin reductase n=1 Tax=Coniosporium apollinis TaxID=61459 RepID=A0ABQ9NYX6_9PEZI|nr:NAPDH-dependent diflavin reductase [Coniosporium apollinis]
MTEGKQTSNIPKGRVDGSFLPWSLDLRQTLLEYYPLPQGVEPIPDDVLLQPKWILDFADQEYDTETVPPATNGASYPTSGLGATNGQVKAPPDVDLPPEDLLPIPGSLTTTILDNKRLTPPTHWQDVRHLTLSTPTPTPYAPGDVLTIYPRNFPSDVSEFLSTQNWTSIADRPLIFKPTSPSTHASNPGTYPPAPLSHLSLPPGSLTLRSLLQNYLDIMSIPRRSLFALLAHFTTDTDQRDRLVEFTDPALVDELYDYTTRPRRSILEVLQEFDTVKLPWQWACAVLPALRGRQFSIASGGRLKSEPSASFSADSDANDSMENGLRPAPTPIPAMEPGSRSSTGGTRIELLVAIVKYRTVIKRLRQGVCTRYVASLKPGQRISVTLQRGGLNISRAEVGRPVVMVGPGTGVAPMRSLIYERMAWREEDGGREGRDGGGEGEGGRDVLFFGCRNEEADFFFRDEWERLREEAGLDVFAAFSRDQRQKVYVQDLVRQQSRRVYHALATRNGLVYICGSSGKMPQAVREALIEVFQKEGALNREDAERYLLGMEKAGRYKQETW